MVILWNVILFGYMMAYLDILETRNYVIGATKFTFSLLRK